MDSVLEHYQTGAGATAVYPAVGRRDLDAITYCTLGLANEAGELAGKVKKVHRGDVSLAEARRVLVDEAGDILWYLAQFCTEMDITLEELAAMNLYKLMGRAERGTIRGSGDDR